MMPHEDGLSVLRSLAGQPDAPPIIMLSALAADTDRIIGIELGADDYLAKPVNPRELLARLRAVLRRNEPRPAVDAVIRAEWRFEPASFSLFSPAGSEVELTSGEFRLALALARRSGRVVPRDVLLEEMHSGEGDVLDRSIDVAISRLRAKLASHGGADLIRTIRGEGYLFGGLR